MPEPEITFPDSGMHLAVMGALLRDGLLSEEDLKSQLVGIDPDEYPRYRISEAVNCLSSFAVPAAAVAKIRSLSFDGGNRIYSLIEVTIDVDTGGEGTHYQLRSLEGAEQLHELESLNLDGHGYRREDLDLTPLAGHQSLRTLRLSGRCINANVLETLPQLSVLKISYAEVDDPNVLDRLAARGVTVERRPKPSKHAK